MLVPICCHSCGLPLAEFAIVFRTVRAREIRKYLGLRDNVIVPSELLVDPNIRIDLSKVFKGLGITQDCCKRALTSHMDMRDHY